MENEKLGKMDFFRGEETDDLNIKSPDSIDAAPVERVHVSAGAGEAVRDSVGSVDDEKIELWMKNIRDFIRNIDVKAL
jgi:hypothetical protein